MQELAATVIRALIERTGIPPESVEDVLLGNCYPTMDAPAIGRVAALDAGLEVTVPITAVRVLGDVHQLAQAVRNLVDNATRHATT